MMLGSDNAKIESGRLEQPLQSACHPVKIQGDTYNLYDTVGLGEHSGNVDAARATGNLYRLVSDLSDAGGINLLVYVVRGNKRPVETMRKHYSLIHHGFCNSNVPIVIVVTGCENVGPDMDSWWTDNASSFMKNGMPFDGHACVCAYKGPRTRNGGYRNQDLVDESESAVTRLIVQHCNPTGWKKVWHPYSQSSQVQNSLKHFSI
jgi:hypothetical protein